MTEIFTLGRICYKTKGRDAGSKVIVVESGKEGYVTVEGTRTKKSRANMQHLLPTTHTVSLSQNYTKEDIQDALKGDAQ